MTHLRFEEGERHRQVERREAKILIIILESRKLMTVALKKEFSRR